MDRIKKGISFYGELAFAVVCSLWIWEALNGIIHTLGK